MSNSRDSTRSPTLDSQELPGAFPAIDQPDQFKPISAHYSLSQAVHARKSEFTRQHDIRIKVGSWNVASKPGTEKDIAGWFVGGKGVSESLAGMKIDSNVLPHSEVVDGSGAQEKIESVERQEWRATKKEPTIPKNDPGSVLAGDEIGLYAVGLQEIVDISSATEALRPYTDSSVAKKWKEAMSAALPAGYTLVAEQQLIGLLLLVYASPKIAPTVGSVSTTSVGTGLMGYMGNKGAVTVRIILGETTRLVFINCHLSAGAEKGSVERRNWDVSQITSRTKFDPVTDSTGVTQDFGEGIGQEDFAFWFGDLNYRIEGVPAEDVRRLLMLHTRNEYDIGSQAEQKIEKQIEKERKIAEKHTDTLCPPELLDSMSDPTSLQTTLDSLLPHDELHQQQKERKAFHDGWQEGPITFLPTYKYDVGSVGLFDSSEKRRGPSWCDRILYRTRRAKLEYEKKVEEEEEAKKKDEEMKARGLDKVAQNDEEVLFEYNPDTDGAPEEYDEYNEEEDAADDGETVITKEGFEDKIHLEHYVTHQRVLSSDHKPLDAVFALTYDAVVPELKARITQEVARELDRAENEGRPCITVVCDHHLDQDSPKKKDNDNSQPFEGVDFGDVRYGQTKIRTVTIANTGRVPATFGFVDRPVEPGKPSSISPRWLRVQFDRPSDKDNSIENAIKQYTLEPGDVANAVLELNVDHIDMVREFNDGKQSIDDVLVLRVKDGRDHFLAIRGNWQQSSFARSLDKLVRVPEGGIRRLQHQKPEGSGSKADREQGVKWSAPRELFRLTEAIEELTGRTLAEWGMTADAQQHPPWEMHPGWPFAPESWTLAPGTYREGLTVAAREGLDTDTPFQSLFEPEVTSIDRLEALSETLVAFLQSLNDGIITESLWGELERGILAQERAKTPHSGEDERTWVMDVLSAAPSHSIAFTFLIHMLSYVANEVAPVQNQQSASEARASMESQGSQRSRARSRTVSSQDPAVSRRMQVDGKFAEIMAAAMVRFPSTFRDKERKASQDRAQYILQLFLWEKWGHGN
ncbi:DNase I-like protein [Xylona heveae TC161]|uniref:DNase I-like protein n=1 Tax=Xylona heveae (strain CBS 132557 / TC161) TaxID=1328760 RepID=A0A164ZIM2_XYLHT|nr:DNase I-like protein [Xylona heveae TC161]KZF19144.1 DNase I-like protein [Xylona heveae TC161]